jgi:LSD1 subclass zinc finger protein
MNDVDLPPGGWAAVTDPTTNEYFSVNHERKLKINVQPYNLHPNFDQTTLDQGWFLKCGECATVLAVKKGTKQYRCAVCNTVAQIPAQAAASQWGPLLQEGATGIEFINSPWSFLDAGVDFLSQTVEEATDVLSSAPTMAARGVEMGVKELPLPGQKG